ncbi:hypothetical protein BDY21DRAFT_371829 [Lineolata rhizophorae]|uniref:Uncharacterized protein n=1 Tax=Lineolata rhizophorae TaxID=578093 RepID=A0A6A6P1R3_9PEZI|nr:hypothetical protein BDY21DRAFT_371829 [Lineolata rhizophorae]
MVHMIWAEESYNYTAATVYLEVDNATNATTTMTISQRPQSDYEAWAYTNIYLRSGGTNATTREAAVSAAVTYNIDIVTETEYTTTFPWFRETLSPTYGTIEEVYTETFTWPTQYVIIPGWSVWRWTKDDAQISANSTSALSGPLTTGPAMCDAVEDRQFQPFKPESYIVVTMPPEMEPLATWTDYVNCATDSDVWDPCMWWVHTNIATLPSWAWPSDLTDTESCTGYIRAIPTAKVPISSVTSTVVSYRPGPVSRTTAGGPAPTTPPPPPRPEPESHPAPVPDDAPPTGNPENEPLSHDAAPLPPNEPSAAPPPVAPSAPPAPITPLAFTVGSSTFTANDAGQFVVDGSQTLSAGGAPVSVGDTLVWQVPEGTAIVVGGTAQAVPGTPAPVPGTPAPAPQEQQGGAAPGAVVTIGPSSVTANGAGAFVFDGQTLRPGGPAITVDGTPVREIPAAAATAGGAPILLLGGTLQPLTGNAGASFTLGAATYAADAQGRFVVSGHTLAAGGPGAVVSGTAVALVAAGTAVVVGPAAGAPGPSSTQLLSPPGGAAAAAQTSAHVLTLPAAAGGATLTADHWGGFALPGGPTLRPGGPTLRPGGPPVTLGADGDGDGDDAVVLSEAADGAGLVVVAGARTSSVALGTVALAYADVVGIILGAVREGWGEAVAATAAAGASETGADGGAEEDEEDEEGRERATRPSGSRSAAAGYTWPGLSSSTGGAAAAATTTSKGGGGRRVAGSEWLPVVGLVTSLLVYVLGI